MFGIILFSIDAPNIAIILEKAKRYATLKKANLKETNS
jgi:hypothetical protein